jgi:AcrR family transcriptional regulator
MTNGKRRYGRSRRDLAEAAIRQFEEKGFSATTVEDVAEAAGYSPRTFFRQFSSKEDVVFFDLPDILDPLQELLREPPASAWTAVSTIVVKNATAWEAAGVGLAQTRTRLLHDEPALYRRYLEISAEWESVITRIFAAERGTDPEHDPYPQVLACSIVGACRAAMRRWLVDPGTGLGEHTAVGLHVIRSGFGLDGLDCGRNAPDST